MYDLKKNEIYTVEIEGYSSEGFGVCRIGGRAVFVPETLVGESWEIKLLKVGASAVYAKALRCLSPSAARIAPACPHFGRCGGCDCCHMSYEEELRFKLRRVNETLKRIGRQTFEVTEILGSEQQERYRNKAIFAVAERDGVPAFGFYRPRSHELIPVEDCLLQRREACRAAEAVLRFMRDHSIRAYDELSGRGHVRHVFYRGAVQGTDAVVCIVSARGFGTLTQELVEALRGACPELSGIVLNINKSRGNTVLSGDFHCLWGRAEIRDRLCGLEFSIAPQAFFQINPPQAEKLYERAAAYALADSPALVLDLYCGAGTISLCLAKEAARVIGAEIVPEAIGNARENAERNAVHNAEFLCADAAEAARHLAEQGLRPGAIVVDPPRKGLSGDTIRAIASMAPPRVVYVSCNPATLARDVLLFQEQGYSLRDACAVDMFPRTSHVETVVALSHQNAQ